MKRTLLGALEDLNYFERIGKKDIIVFDIDGTLSIVGDRLKYIKGEEKDWDSFYNFCYEDAPNLPIVDLCRTLSVTNHIVYATGRIERVRDITLKWLEENNLPCNTDQLFMRDNNDGREDDEVKPELIATVIDSVKMVFEDRSSVVAKWREMGIPCCQVAPGDF